MKLSTVIKKGRKIIMFTTLTFLIIALIITFAQPLKYRAQAKVLVVQNFEEGTDSYSASKMNEYLSNLLAKIVSSESFYSQSTKDGFNIDTEYFSGSKKKQMTEWNSTVQAKAIYDSGIISLSVYHPNKQQAENIARAVIFTLKTTNNFYHSLQNVDVRIIDSPSISVLPVKPNIILNVLIGIIFGAAAGILFVYQKHNK
ncbi:MAG: Wzz/FepE/Etk N-terminal domain-containing protein [Patescibacteria group bacterium]|jgi:capsular polysaccharide biosynthesis protein